MLNPAISKILKTFGFSIILVTISFIFTPLTLYLGNVDEFASPFAQLLYLMIIPGLLVIAGLIMIGSALNKSGYDRFITLIAVISLAVWLQSNILVWNYGLLDGDGIQWEFASWRGLVDIIVWLLLLSMGYFFYRETGKFFLQMSATIFILQSVIFIVAVWTHRDNLSMKQISFVSDKSLHEMYRFSSQKNVIHIVLDSFQSDIFRDIIDDPQKGNIYKAALEGFTFYEENTGAFPYTHFSLPAIMSGEAYHNNMPKAEFISKIFRGNTILNSAYAAGYQVDFATETLLLKMLTQGQYNNAYLVSSNLHISSGLQLLKESAKLMDLTLFRISPHYIKPFIYNNHHWLMQNLIGEEDYWKFLYFSHNAFLHKLSRSIKVDRNFPVYKFFHLMGPHAPMVVNEDCTYAGVVLQRNRATATAQSRCTLDFAVTFLEAMKKTGIYDDALIIIMADHGGYIPPLRYNPDKVGESQPFIVNPETLGLATPLLLIKVPYKKGSMEISDVPASMFDVAATINSLLDLKGNFSGRSIVELSTGEKRERKFYYYEWKPEDWKNYGARYIFPIQEFIIKGSPYIGASWYPANVFKAPAD